MNHTHVELALRNGVLQVQTDPDGVWLSQERGERQEQRKRENLKSEELTELRDNCRKWGHKAWHGEEKHVN